MQGLAPFLAAAADWLGAIEVSVLDGAPGRPDELGRVVRDWLDGGGDPDHAVQVLDGERVELARVDTPEGVRALVVRRSLRRPRPASQGERVAAVAELTGCLLAHGPDIGAVDREDQPRRRLAAALDAAGGGAVFVVGVDRLAVVNEVLGRPAGDVVLDELMRRLRDWAGADAETVRLSGARVGVARTDLREPTAALAATDALRQSLAEPVQVDGLTVSRSVSVGVAAGTGTSGAELVVQAVRGCLAARESGGDTVRAYDAAAADERIARLRLELELDRALRNGELHLFYQPEFDLRTGRLLAVEALLRWQHPRLGLVRADAFVDDTERTRTFAAVQVWVIEQACRQLADWQTRGAAPDLALRINVSAWQILREEIVAEILACIDRFGLPPQSVCIELTERRMPRSPERVAATLGRLVERGLSVAIDDFGTGQGTITQLTTLPVDTIKIDQSFVAAMRDDPRADAVVAGIIALAASLSLETVAEGVDGADTAARLVQLGCLRGQGNSLGPAMPVDELTALLPPR